MTCTLSLRISAILVMFTYTSVLVHAQTDSRHGIEIFVQPFSSSHPLSNIQSIGTGTTLHSNASSTDLEATLGLSYEYCLNQSWSLRSSVSYVNFSPVVIGFTFDNPHFYTSVSGFSSLTGIDSYGLSSVGTLLVDIGPLWTLVEGRLLNLRTGLAIGLMANQFDINRELNFGYLADMGQTGQRTIELGEITAQKNQYFSSFTTWEVISESKLGKDGFYLSGGFFYRFFLSRITKDASLQLIDGTDNVSEYLFNSGLRQLGVRLGIGYRF